MKKILILGAGRSTTYLIEYLLSHAEEFDFEITVADASLTRVNGKTKSHPRSIALEMNSNDDARTFEEIGKADIVVSMLPPALHPGIASFCIGQKKPMVTASYTSQGMKAMEGDIVKAGIIIVNEAGLDPGLDHASAMRVIQHIKDLKAKLCGFKSFTGGVLSPENISNPWGYKFTWNPSNVIVAGQGTAKYIYNSNPVYIPYHKLFTRIEKIHIEGIGDFEGYANRDSLPYRFLYGIDDIPNIIRGTLRLPRFCEAWNIFVQLGITDDSYVIPGSEKLTMKEFVELFLPPGKDSIKQRLAVYMNIPAEGKIMNMLEWTGIFDDSRVTLKDATPAQILQALLEVKWQMMPGDKDMIVMLHEVDYERDGNRHRYSSHLMVKGDDMLHTAMAKTVGLPVAIVTKLILTGEIALKGLYIPTVKEIYIPLLKELETLGLKFVEKDEVMEWGT
jgi:saccharopine dehydrogenase-like NADP-dependent oxidoreductase